MNWQIAVLLPLAGAFIGWVTNAIAVRMLFRPYNPIKIPGFFYTFQGVIPKRRHELARSIGEVIEKELLPVNELIAQFSLPELAEGLSVYINAVIRQKIMERLPGFIPVSLKNVITETLVDLVKKQLPSVINRLGNDLSDNLKSKIHLGELVEDKLNRFDLEKLEAVILKVARRELRHVEILGGVLGFIVGVFQVALLYIVR